MSMLSLTDSSPVEAPGNAQLTIGILALQGDFAEHAAMLNKLGVKTVWVRLPQHLNSIDGLILPGGESTTFTHLFKIKTAASASYRDLWSAIRYHATERRMALWGSCAGAIALAQNIELSTLDTLALLPITMRRNAFGSHMHSSIQNIKCSLQDQPFPAVFIRAPQITQLHSSQIEILAEWGEKDSLQLTPPPPTRCILAVRYHHILATVFHPELTSCSIFHRYFLNMVNSA